MQSSYCPFTQCLRGCLDGFPIGTSVFSRYRLSLATAAARAFLTSASINITRVCRILNRFSIHPRALSLLIHIQRDTSVFATVFLELNYQNARRKGKVHRWKGRREGLCGEDPEVSQREGWSAGQYVSVILGSCWRSVGYHVTEAIHARRDEIRRVKRRVDDRSWFVAVAGQKGRLCLEDPWSGSRALLSHLPSC